MGQFKSSAVLVNETEIANAKLPLSLPLSAVEQPTAPAISFERISSAPLTDDKTGAIEAMKTIKL